MIHLFSIIKNFFKAKWVYKKPEHKKFIIYDSGPLKLFIQLY